MTEKQSTSKHRLSADWFLRGALTKIGDTFDKFTGRKWIPSSSLATSELIEAMKKLLDAEARAVPGKGTVVPHNIKLKVQWDKFSTDADDALAKLECELLAAAADHINDSLYYTFAPLTLEVKPDYFTEGVKLFVSFGKIDDDTGESELSVAMPDAGQDTDGGREIGKSEQITNDTIETFIARFELNGSRRDRRFEIPVGSRLSIGRTGGNDLILDDMSVSKVHASLICDSERFLSVADTGSTNGTFVNDQRIAYGKATRLFMGDRVKFGDVEVVFENVPVERPAIIERPSEDISNKDTVAIGGLTFSSRVSPDPVARSTFGEVRPGTATKTESAKVDDETGVEKAPKTGATE